MFHSYSYILLRKNYFEQK